MAGGLVGSEILKIAADIRALLAVGHQICNLTVGDFNSKYFQIPDKFLELINTAYQSGETNYPPSDGMLPLRQAIQNFYERRLGLSYPLESVVVTGGARPAIYATYAALIDKGDRVVYPVPSWNNNHYCQLTGAEGVPVLCDETTQFLPTADMLRPFVSTARMIALCSPLNPTGTMFSRDALLDIAQMVLEENRDRERLGSRPLYLLYDQIYWMLTFGGNEHYDPVSLIAELAPYTIFVDGMSKAFASTGVRVGWFVAPKQVASAMSNIVGHIGAWAPRPEQVAAASFLMNDEWIDDYTSDILTKIDQRLERLFEGFKDLKESGFPVDAIAPMGAIYLTAQVNLLGKTLPNGRVVRSNEEIRKYLLETARIAVVPFQAFGSWEESGWFRLSVGAVSMEEIEQALPRLREALADLQ